MRQSSPTKLRILHVEDNDLDAEAVSRAMRKLGLDYELGRATDGVDALEKLSLRGDCDLAEGQMVILLDINMPRMNGLEFLKALRSTEEFQRIPVFVFTTSDHPQDVTAAHDRHVNGYIVKPTGSEGMLKVLNTLSAFWTICEQPPLNCV